MNIVDTHLKDLFPFLGYNDCDPRLTAFLPNNIQSLEHNRPCLLICPGGGYQHCSQREAEPIALHFLAEGYNVFILWYSCSPNRFPTQIREVAAAIEVINRNSQDWHCDTKRLVLMGFSAGGHLAAHYTNAFDCSEVRKYFPESKAVNASILCYPVITTDDTYSHKGSFKNLLGEDFSGSLERFSCEKLVSDRTPPTFLVHAADDSCVPAVNSLLYAGQLAKHNIPYELHVYPKGNHGFSTADKNTVADLTTPYRVHAWLRLAIEWLQEIFES